LTMVVHIPGRSQGRLSPQEPSHLVHIEDIAGTQLFFQLRRDGAEWAREAPMLTSQPHPVYAQNRAVPVRRLGQ